MTVIRVERDKNNPYTVINNTILKDTRLSLKAKGLMCYLLSLPSDWKIYLEEIEKHHLDKEGSIRTGIKELMACGYVHRVKITDKNGRIVSWDYILYECPDRGYPDVDNPDVDNPGLDNQGLQSTNKQNTEIQIALCANCADKREIPLVSDEEKVSHREKPKTFRADKLIVDFAFKCIAVKHGMDRTWIESEFERFKSWWIEAAPKNRPCKTLGHWKQSWDTWCSRISNTLRQPQLDVVEKDEFLPAMASIDKFLKIAKDQAYPYHDRVEAAGGYDHCYVHGFPRPRPGETTKREAE